MCCLSSEFTFAFKTYHKHVIIFIIITINAGYSALICALLFLINDIFLLLCIATRPLHANYDIMSYIFNISFVNKETLDDFCE